MSNWELKCDDLETFTAFDAPTRALILRLLDEPTDADFAALKERPNAVMLATWLGELPAYSSVGYGDDE